MVPRLGLKAISSESLPLAKSQSPAVEIGFKRPCTNETQFPTQMDTTGPKSRFGAKFRCALHVNYVHDVHKTWTGSKGCPRADNVPNSEALQSQLGPDGKCE